MSYIGNEPIVSATRTVTEVTATAGQTVFTVNGGYTVGYLDVFLNGAQLQNTDFGAVNGSTVTLLQAAQAGDDVRLVAWGTFTTADIPVVRKGVTTVTLSSSTPSETITASSNQVINIVTNGTKPASPSVVLPNMTTVQTGYAYFMFVNTTELPVALKDSSGVVREYIAPGQTLPLIIRDNGTATGFWFANNPPTALAFRQTDYTTFSIARVGTNTFILGTILVPLTDTTFAVLWLETPGSGTGVLYGQLYSFNASTGQISTSGTRVTIASFGSMSSNDEFLKYFAYDIDQEGRALVGLLTKNTGSGFPYLFHYFGISSFGGQLYASALTTQGLLGTSNCDPPFADVLYLAYIGNNAYALAFTTSRQFNPGGTIYIRGCTVTGTTSLTLTNSASNTTLGTSAVGTRYASRTGLTTFTVGAPGNIGRAVAYTPSANTFTVVTRTVQTILPIENSWWYGAASFREGGFYYGTSDVHFGGLIYEVANAGTVSVSADIAPSYNLKIGTSPNYSLPNGRYSPGGYSTLIQGTELISIGNSYTIADTTTAMNVHKYGATGGLLANTVITSPTTALTYDKARNSALTAFTFAVKFAEMATPLRA
jgi:hypothetical protein